MFLFLSALTIVFSAFSCALAANADVSGLWSLASTNPPMNAHMVITTVAGTIEQDMVMDIQGIFDFSGNVNQSPDGTIHSNVSSPALSETLTGKVTGNTLTFKITTVISSSTTMAITLIMDSSGSISNGKITGTFEGSYRQDVADLGSSVVVTGTTSGTFTVTILGASGVDTFLTSTPPAKTPLHNASFKWTGTSSAGIAGYYYSLDGKTQTYTTATSITFTKLACGAHSFSVAAKDKKGKIDSTPATCSFTIADVDPPLDANRGQPANDPQNTVGDPINVVNGNMHMIAPDITLSGRALKFEFIRTYNNQEKISGPLGVGWTHSYNLTLATDSSTGYIKIKDEEAKACLFVPQGDGTFIAQRGEYSTLTKDKTSYTWRKKDGKRYIFDLTCKLSKIVDRNNNTISFTYDAKGNLTKITDTAARVINLTYNAQNQITRVSDFAGRNFDYAYDGTGNLVSAADPAGNSITYQYDANHNITKKTDAEETGIFYL